MEVSKDFMERCFYLAQLGAGNVAPNPMVGAVIVYDNKIIGEGWHKKYGSAHAEVNAVNSVKDKNLLKNSVIYVSLEPCSHYGKTPPCAELIVKSGIKKCVIANYDPNPKVAGKGIQMLKDAGIEVVCGVEQEKGRFINRRFFCFQEKKRPYIIIKIAQSYDGYMDINPLNCKTSRQPYWITNDAMKVFVHKLRSENDAFFVGANTVINDNCRLNTRYYSGKDPIRLTFDRDLSIPDGRHFFDNNQKTIVFNNKENKTLSDNLQFIKLEGKEAYEQEIVQNLYDKGVSSLVIEGGKRSIEAFLQIGLWDEIIVITSDKIFHGGIKTPAVDSEYKASTSTVSNDRIDFYYNRNAW